MISTDLGRAEPLSGLDQLSGLDRLDQRRAPLLDAVRQEAGAAVARPHCPGHQGGARSGREITDLLGGAMFAADVWLSTHRHDQVRREAEALAAQAWRADRAWLVGNGSTGGNLAWMLAALPEGAPVIVGRDAHTSVLAGLVLSGARPVWVAPRLHDELGLPLGVDPAELGAALGDSPGSPRAPTSAQALPARHVVLTSPGYAGSCADLPALVGTAGRLGAEVYVDQAWGPHLAFAGQDGPVHALDVGAAGCVVSVHKTGTALSSGAVLLAGPGVPDDLVARVDRAVRMTQTTSPLMPLLASIDAARRDFALGGAEAVEAAILRAATLARRLRAVPGLRVIDATELGLPVRQVDRLKLVVDVAGLGTTGWAVEAALRRAGVPPEGADDRRVYAVLAGESRAGAFAAALESIAAGSGPAGSRPAGPAADTPRLWAEALHCGRQVLSPREAHGAPSRAVPLRAAIGHVVAEPVVPYPPGVPVLLPGEEVGAGAVEVLRSVLAGGGHVHGCADPALATLRVVG